MRGLAGRVRILWNTEAIAEHPRGADTLILRNEAHYDGEDTDRVRAPMPLGRMGRRLAEIAASNVQHRSIDLYARLVEVAR